MSYPRKRAYGPRSYQGSTPSHASSPATPEARALASSTRVAATSYQSNGAPGLAPGCPEAYSPSLEAKRSKFKLTVHLIRDAPPQFEVSMRAIGSPASKLAFPSPASPAVGILTPTRATDSPLFVNHMAPDSPAVKIHEKFVVLVSPTATIDELKQQLQTMYLRLYPRHAPITVLRVQDGEFSDVFDEYNVSDVFADLDSFYAIVAANDSAFSSLASTNIDTNVNRKRSLEQESSDDMQTPKRARPELVQNHSPPAAAKNGPEFSVGRFDVKPGQMTNGTPEPAPAKSPDLPQAPRHAETQPDTHRSRTAAKTQAATVAPPAPKPLPHNTPEKFQTPVSVGFETPSRPVADRKPAIREPSRTSAIPVKTDLRLQSTAPIDRAQASPSVNTNTSTPTRPLNSGTALTNRPGVLSEVAFSSSSNTSDSDVSPAVSPGKAESLAPPSSAAKKPVGQVPAPASKPTPNPAKAPAPQAPSAPGFQSQAIPAANVTPVKLESSTYNHTPKPMGAPPPINQPITVPAQAPPSPEPVVKLEPLSTPIPPASSVVRIDSPVYISSTTASSSESDSDSDTESSSVAETATDSGSGSESVSSTDTTTDSSSGASINSDMEIGSDSSPGPSSSAPLPSTIATTVGKQPVPTSTLHSTRLPSQPKNTNIKPPAPATTVAKQAPQLTVDNRSTVLPEPAVKPQPKPKSKNPFQAPIPSAKPSTTPIQTPQSTILSGGCSSLTSHSVLKKGNFASLSAIAASGSFRHLEQPERRMPGTRGTGHHSANSASSGTKSGELYVNSDSEEESGKQASATDSDASSSGSASDSDTDSDSSSDSDSNAKPKQNKKTRVAAQSAKQVASSAPPVAIKVAGSRAKKKRKSRLAELSSMF